MPEETSRPKLEVVSPTDLSEPIPIPGEFSLQKFKSTQAHRGRRNAADGAATYRIAQAKDFVRLHPNEDEYWSPELCFVTVPIKGQKRDTLHLIDEDLASNTCRALEFSASGLALATKPHDVFFLCHVPTRNLDNIVERDRPPGLRAGKDAVDAGVTSRRDEGVDGYKIDSAARPRCVPATEVADAVARTS